MLMRHVVYFILAPKAQMVKIGQCREGDPPTNRLKALQTGNPETLEVLLVLDCKPPFEEDQLHWRFRKYRGSGEWFEYRDELLDFVKKKRLNPSITSDDDAALIEKDRDGNIVAQYVYPRNDKKWPRSPESLTSDDSRPPLRSPIYKLGPRWRRGDDYEYGNEAPGAYRNIS